MPQPDFLDFEVTEFEVVPPGRYPARLKAIEPFTGGKFGDALKFIFEITGGEWAGITVDGIASKTMTEKSKLFAWYNGLTGENPPPGMRGSFRPLIGRECDIMVNNKTTGQGGVFAQVTDVYPRQASRRRTAAPPPTPADADDEDV